MMHRSVFIQKRHARPASGHHDRIGPRQAGLEGHERIRRRLIRADRQSGFRFQLARIGLDDAGAVIARIVRTARIHADWLSGLARQSNGRLDEIARDDASPIV